MPQLAAFIAFFALAAVAHSAPYYQQTAGLVPSVTNTHYIGTSSPSLLEYKSIYTRDLVVSGTCTGCGSSSGGTFPFTATTNYNSTSTPIGFLGGLFSVGSTTVNGTFKVSSTTGTLIVDGPRFSTLSATTPDDLRITGGNATSGDNEGADVTFTAGSSSGNSSGGDLIFTSGTGGDTGGGGDFDLTAGSGGATSGSGGDFNLEAGSAPLSGNGGAFTLLAGAGNGNGSGGTVNITAGNGDGTGEGGTITLQPGVRGATGIDGKLILGGTVGTDAHFDTSQLATTNKTFYFPNVTGDFGIGVSTTTGRLAYWGAPGLYSVATSSLSVGTGLTNSGTLGSQVGGSAASISFAAIAANSIWANRTSASAVPAVLATSSLGVALSDTTGTLAVARGGTGLTSFAANQLLYGGGNGTTVASVATTTLAVSGPFTVSGTLGALVGGANATINWTGISTSTALAANQVVYGTAAGTVGSEAAFTYTATTNNLTFDFASSTSLTATRGAWLGTLGGNVGIGTTTPFAQLSINPLAGVLTTNPVFAIGSSTAFTNFGSGTLFAINQYGQIDAVASQPATSTSIQLDWSRTPNQVEYRIGGAATQIAVINATTSDNWGSRKLVPVCNPGGTAGALTWVGVEWIGTAPTQTTAANQCDIYSFAITRATSSSAYKVMGSMGAGFQ